MTAKSLKFNYVGIYLINFTIFLAGHAHDGHGGHDHKHGKRLNKFSSTLIPDILLNLFNLFLGDDHAAHHHGKILNMNVWAFIKLSFNQDPMTIIADTLMESIATPQPKPHMHTKHPLENALNISAGTWNICGMR